MRPGRRVASFLVPLAITAVLALLDASGLLAPAHGWVHDELLRVRAARPAAREVLLVDIDAQATALAGPWPWTRDYLADGVLLLKEMDARTVILDVPLSQRSLPALDPAALRRTLPDALEREFSVMEENIRSLFDAIRRGSVRPQDSARYVSDLVGLVTMAKIRLYDAATGIERDDDALLGAAAGVFGPSFVPLELLPSPDESVGRDLLALAAQRQSLGVSVVGFDPSLRASGLRPSVLPVVQGARGGGFPARVTTPDRVLRTMFLTAAAEDRHYGQIGFSALVDLLGSPSVDLSRGSVRLRNAVLPGSSLSSTITIPLTESGDVILSWPRAALGDGFRHVSWADLIRLRQLEDSLVSVLREMDSLGYLSYLRSNTNILDAYDEGVRLLAGMRASSGDAGADSWRAMRQRFFILCDQFLNGDAEGRVLQDAARALRNEELSEEDSRAAAASRAAAPRLFGQAREDLGQLQSLRAAISAEAAASFCVVSLGTGDGGAARTPFGTPTTTAAASAALAHTVLTGSFLTQVPRRAAWALAAALGLVLAAVGGRLRPPIILLVTLGAATVTGAVLGAVFALRGAELAPVVPIAAALLSGVALAAVQAARRRREVRALRRVFEAHLSRQNLRALVSHFATLPGLAQQAEVTVLSLAETELPSHIGSVSAEDIARRLSASRDGAGEVIRGLDGMHAASRADGWTAYFGAPVAREDHARRACVAALRILAVERELNPGPRALQATGIGIDTGPCVVAVVPGRAEYTVIGTPTDVASRIRGLNRFFGTSVLVTERVRTAAGGGFLTRRLERIRLSGIDSALRVYELMAETGAAGAAGEAAEQFEEGVDLFEKGDLRGALAAFQNVLQIAPGDRPASVYAERCRRPDTSRAGDPTSFPW